MSGKPFYDQTMLEASAGDSSRFMERAARGRSEQNSSGRSRSSRLIAAIVRFQTLFESFHLVGPG
jgi:hypothetical protein